MNHLLHCLANRTQPLSTSPRYTGNFAPATVSDLELALRRKLCLDRAGDYYLRNLMANLHSWPDLWQNVLGFRDEDFTPLDLRRPGVWVDGGELLADESGVASFEEFGLLQTLPVSMDWTLSWQQADTGLLQDDLTGRKDSVRVRASTEVLRVSWPAWAPFAGPLRIIVPWLEGSIYKLHVEPASFPWAVAAQTIQSDPQLDQWLMRAGLVDEYRGSGNPRLKVALATALIIINHPAY